MAPLPVAAEVLAQRSWQLERTQTWDALTNALAGHDGPALASALEHVRVCSRAEALATAEEPRTLSVGLLPPWYSLVRRALFRLVESDDGYLLTVLRRCVAPSLEHERDALEHALELRAFDAVAALVREYTLASDVRELARHYQHDAEACRALTAVM